MKSAASGYCKDSGLDRRGNYGYYWTSTYEGGFIVGLSVMSLYFYKNSQNPSIIDNVRDDGLSIRTIYLISRLEAR